MKNNNLIDSILSLCASAFNAYSVVFFEISNERSGACRMLSSFTRSDKLDPGTIIYPGKGLTGWILRNNMPVVLNSIEENQAYLTYYLSENRPAIRSFMGCPVSDKGIICVDSIQRNAFPQEKQKLLHEFAVLIDQTLSFSFSSERQEWYLSGLEEIKQLRRPFRGWRSYLSHFTALLLKTTSFEYAAFASTAIDESYYQIEFESPDLLRGSSREFSIYSDIIGWVFRNNQAVFQSESSVSLFCSTDSETEFSCCACMPVLMENNLCSVVFLGAHENISMPKEKRLFLKLACDELSSTLDWLSHQRSMQRLR